jgi:hypothetical protein
LQRTLGGERGAEARSGRWRKTHGADVEAGKWGSRGQGRGAKPAPTARSR